jgi:hypothetical protein
MNRRATERMKGAVQQASLSAAVDRKFRGGTPAVMPYWNMCGAISKAFCSRGRVENERGKYVLGLVNGEVARGSTSRTT